MARKAAEEAARKAGDTEALDKSWNQKYTEALSVKDNELNSLGAPEHPAGGQRGDQSGQ